MMDDGLGALRPDGATQSRDIAELVADAMRLASPAPAATSKRLIGDDDGAFACMSLLGCQDLCSKQLR